MNGQPKGRSLQVMNLMCRGVKEPSKSIQIYICITEGVSFIYRQIDPESLRSNGRSPSELEL